MDEAKWLSVERCRKVLEEGGGTYSDDQVKMIRDVLYSLAELDYLIFRQKQNPEDRGESDSDKAA